MGVIKQGILGGFRGRVANVVGTSWKGIAVIKGMPLSVANPRTAAQVTNRNQFSSVVLFAVALLSTIIKPLLDRVAVQMSGYNLFVQLNKDLFDETGLITPNGLVISKGTVTNIVPSGTVASEATGNVVISYPNNTGNGDALVTDQLYVAVFNQDAQMIYGFSAVAARNGVTATVNLTDLITEGDNLYVYTAMRRADGSRSSDTSVSSTIVGA